MAGGPAESAAATPRAAPTGSASAAAGCARFRPSCAAGLLYSPAQTAGHSYKHRISPKFHTQPDG